MAFTHLHVHTQYSLLDGSNKISEYVKRVKELGMSAAAITDHGVMFGVIEFYKACKKEGINPVLGCEVYVSPGSRFDREKGNDEDRYYHLILLAENNTGYQNLMKIVSKGYIDGFYYKPRVDHEILEKYHEGLICLSACLAGEVPKALSREDYEGAKKIALWYREVFGENNYFLEMQDHGIPMQATVNQGLLRLSKELGIPLVVTNDAHYTYESDAEAHDVLLCIQTGKKVSDTDRMRYEGGQYFVKSEEEMLSLFPYAMDAVYRTQEIADRCHVEIEFGVTKLPRFDVPEGFDAWTYLNKLCFDGLKRRYPKASADEEKKLTDQLNYELSVIQKMGYVDYFLIVWDFINYARENGIPVGPGRGSAAGSLVSYTTGITDIDPVKYSLIFERFLNPERVSMPDIDVDFCPLRRHEVIEYVIDKYGADCVTQIVTFGTMAARGVVRDVGRVLDLPYALCDQVAKAVPATLGQGVTVTIDLAMQSSPDLKNMYNTDETVKNLIDTAKKLEGLPRNTSMHAAGVVISEKPMDEYVPLATANDGTPVTQFTMTTIEELGLLKMDFLGLRNLTVIDDTIQAVYRRTGEKIDFNSMEYDDPEVFKLLSAGKTAGVFQLESSGMTNFIKELRPESLEDIIAGIALYRPGPMDFIPKYIAGKNSKKEVTYDCEELKPILESTYGCIVYQEQVMQIVQSLAGYSLGQADILRRAMSKKKGGVMEENRKYFIYGNEAENLPGCVKNGIKEDVATKIYKDMEDFAKYAFNKSHAAAYAVVAYQTAWLKVHYPLEFMAALLTSVIGNKGKCAEYISACRGMGIDVLPPSVNEGEGVFSVSDGSIRYGMCAIKSIGEGVIEEIVNEREKNGPYRTLEDFIGRTVTHGVNKTAIENLIKAGALDGLDGNRRQMTVVYPAIVEKVTTDKKKSVEGQMSLFDIADDSNKEKLEIRFPDLPEYEKEMLLSFEKDVMDIYVSGHPLDEDTDLLDKNVTADSRKFMTNDDPEDGQREESEDESDDRVHDGETVVVGGLITLARQQITRKNTMMCFLTIEDLFGSLEVVIFPSQYDKFRNILNEGNKVLIKGHVQTRDEKTPQLIMEDIKQFSDVPKKIWIQFEKEAEVENGMKNLDEIIAKSDGTDSIVLYVRENKTRKELPPSKTINGDRDTIIELKGIFGEENVAVTQKKVEFQRNRY